MSGIFSSAIWPRRIVSALYGNSFKNLCASPIRHNLARPRYMGGLSDQGGPPNPKANDRFMLVNVWGASWRLPELIAFSCELYLTIRLNEPITLIKSSSWAEVVVALVSMKGYSGL